MVVYVRFGLSCASTSDSSRMHIETSMANGLLRVDRIALHDIGRVRAKVQKGDVWEAIVMRK